MAKNTKRIRGTGEFCVPKTWEVHPDAIKSLDRVYEKFRSFYRKKQLVTFGIVFLEKILRERGIKPGNDIEELLGIQAVKSAGSQEDVGTGKSSAA